MTTRALSNGRLVDPGGHGVPHGWAYLPDVARAGALLLERHAELEPHAVFHFEGYGVDTVGMLDAVRRGLSKPSLRTLSVPWWLLVGALVRSRACCDSFSASVTSGRSPRCPDGGKLRRTLPEFRVTPLDEAVKLTLEWMMTKRGDAPRSRGALDSSRQRGRRFPFDVFMTSRSFTALTKGRRPKTLGRRARPRAPRTDDFSRR